MKCYCVTFDLNKRSSKTVYVSKNSTFQIGIKCYKDGQLLNAKAAQLISPDGTQLNVSGALADYATWTLTSGAEEAAYQYKYKAAYNKKVVIAGEEMTVVSLIELPPLTIVTTSSDVAELPGIVNADLTDYYTKEQVDTKVTEAVAPLAPASSLTAYWKKSDTEEHQLSGTYEDGTEFSFTAICKKA